MNKWIQALRLPFSTATVIPVILGGVIAWYETSIFNWSLFLICLFGVLFFHLGTNLANDYYDQKNDEKNKNHNQFTGGSRVIQQNLIAPKKILYASLVFFILGLLLFLYLGTTLRSGFIIGLAVIGFLSGFFYTATPLQIGYHKGGELLVGLCFGPLVVIGTYHVLSLSFSWIALLASLPIGILVALILYMAEFPDYEADKEVGKKTLIVSIGKKKGAKLYGILLGLTYSFILSFTLLRLLPWWSLITLLTIPLALKAYSIAIKAYDNIKAFLPAIGMTIALHLIIGLLLSLSFVLDKFI